MEIAHIPAVEHADTFRRRWRGLRPEANGRRMLFRTRSVHGFGMREPLWAVGLDDDRVVVAVGELRPQSVIRFADASQILELPMSDVPPRLGQRVEIGETCDQWSAHADRRAADTVLAVEPPEMKPWNLYLRLVIELMAFGGIWAGTWIASTSWIRWLGVVTGPLIAATIWGVFNVPNDPSRSGRAPIRVSGRVRLLIELVVLGAGLWGWLSSGRIDLAAVYLVALIVHHAASIPRLQWLMNQARNAG